MTPKEIKKIKEVLGNHYTGKVIPHLTKKGIINADGKEFSPESIRKIVNGNQYNTAVELEILRLVQRTEKKNSLLAQTRKAITQKK